MSLYLHRQILKARLLEIQPRCPLTLRPIRSGADMHEWLVPRNMLPKSQQLAIYHIYNVVLLDHSLHDQGLSCAQRLVIAAFKIKQHGYDAIAEWLTSLNLKTFGSLQQQLERWKIGSER